MFSNLFGDGRMGGILALVIGICLLGLIVIYAWRAFGRGIRPASGRGARQSRLGIVDAFDIDRHRQLVIVRRDNVEHLIMIGGPNDLLIEDAIVRAQPHGSERREPTAAPAPGQGERQPPRVPFETVVAPMSGQGGAQAPSVEDNAAADEPASAPASAPTPAPMPAPPAAPGPGLRPSLDSAFAEAFAAPPPPQPRPAPPAGARPIPQTMPSPLPQSLRQAQPRPAPQVTPPPPRPGAPMLAQRPVTAPSVAPPAPPSSGPEPGREAAAEPPREPPKLTLNIDSLEEEMAKLLGRPVDPPRT